MRFGLVLALISVVLFQAPILICSTVSEVDGVKIVDNGPVIGEFVYDEDYARELAVKEELADRYYAAKIAGDEELAEQLLEEFGNLRPGFLSEGLGVGTRERGGRRRALRTVDKCCGFSAIRDLLGGRGALEFQF